MTSCHFSEKITSLCRNIGVHTAFTSKSTLRNLLTHVKPKIPPENRVGVIYLIPCECGAVYIGETGRNIRIRMQEHIRADKGDKNNAIACHQMTTGHIKSGRLTEENRKTYAGVVNQFDEFYKVRRNIIFERARFNRRNQLDGEMSEQYIAILYNLADTCEYGELKNEMIRDRLVVGISDTALSESLQMDASLTLEKAKTKIRQKEAVRKQQDFLQHDLNRSDLHVDHN